MSRKTKKFEQDIRTQLKAKKVVEDLHKHQVPNSPFSTELAQTKALSDVAVVQAFKRMHRRIAFDDFVQLATRQHCHPTNTKKVSSWIQLWISRILVHEGPFRADNRARVDKLVTASILFLREKAREVTKPKANRRVVDPRQEEINWENSSTRRVPDTTPTPPPTPEPGPAPDPAPAPQEGKKDAVQPMDIVLVHGRQLEAIQNNGKILASIKRICKALGINTAGQQKKLKDCGWARVELIYTHDTIGRKQAICCIDIQYIPKWLGDIDIKRVKPELRNVLMVFQKECARILAQHFGVAPPEEPLAPPIVETAFSAELELLTLKNEVIKMGLKSRIADALIKLMESL